MQMPGDCGSEFLRGRLMEVEKMSFRWRRFLIAGLVAVFFISVGAATLHAAAKESRKKGRTAKVARKAPEEWVGTVKMEAGKEKFFTVKKPAGWNIITAGSGPILSVWMRDPQSPARQAFMFGTVGPFFLTREQKDLAHKPMASGGRWVQWSDMPVVDPSTAGAFLYQWNTLIHTSMAMEFAPRLPPFENLTIISAQPVQARFGGQAELVRALFSQNGEVVEALFIAEVVEYAPSVSDPAEHQGYAYIFSGIAMPKPDFSNYLAPLMRSMESFKLSEQYVSTYTTTSQKAFKNILRASQDLRETADVLTRGWNARQKVDDMRSEKRSDEMLGRERLYDPDTGDAYVFPKGWYNTYDDVREKYNNPNLHPIPERNCEAWTVPPMNGTDHVYLR